VEHRAPTGYTAAHVLHSIMKATKVNNNGVCDLPHCFNKRSINWVQYDTCTKWQGCQIGRFAAKFQKFGRISSWLAVRFLGSPFGFFGRFLKVVWLK